MPLQIWQTNTKKAAKIAFEKESVSILSFFYFADEKPMPARLKTMDGGPLDGG
jgi:hypothetical protein